MSESAARPAPARACRSRGERFALMSPLARYSGRVGVHRHFGWRLGRSLLASTAARDYPFKLRGVQSSRVTRLRAFDAVPRTDGIRSCSKRGMLDHSRRFPGLPRSLPTTERRLARLDLTTGAVCSEQASGVARSAVTDALRESMHETTEASRSVSTFLISRPDG